MTGGFVYSMMDEVDASGIAERATVPIRPDDKPSELLRSELPARRAPACRGAGRCA
jgi:hypothetical protein